ncbi:MAG: replication-associated recombination protein A [Methylacidiphilales bacterium]|nr:replication-associated recombination protein A [Candidatus Methylacidiphilales bacterium]MDW8348656.1 replication-associated recombination protein A [Verrucomicrobiae bacterium]
MKVPQDNLLTNHTPVSQPLATRLRPRSLDEFIGQEHLLSPGKPLRLMIEEESFHSLILIGPPGCGKTTLAEIIARKTTSAFERLNAADSGVHELRKIFQAARHRWSSLQQKTILFLDEIHRYSKSQQDALLPELEGGVIRLIAATTHNPTFSLNPPLLSRSHIFHLHPLSNENLKVILSRALQDSIAGIAPASIESQAAELLILYADGDARRLLNTLEIAAKLAGKRLTVSSESKHITVSDVQSATQRKLIQYDNQEDEHYDTISAFIKSVRGSDPDAALYWLAKMIEGGEDPRFIARRLMILAAEDIGLADPHALTLAEATAGVVERIGMPEGRIPLAQTTIYLAAAPKSNSALLAIDSALDAVRNKPIIPIPSYLRDTYSTTSKLAQQKSVYLYSHDYPQAIAPQTYGVKTGAFYQPKLSGAEAKIKERLERWEELRKALLASDESHE